MSEARRQKPEVGRRKAGIRIRRLTSLIIHFVKEIAAGLLCGRANRMQ